MTQFDPSMLPPQPTLVPDDLRRLIADNTGPGWVEGRIPPDGVAYFVAAVVRWLSHPRMGTRVSCDLVTPAEGGTGWVITVECVGPQGRDDVVVAGT